MNKKFLHKKYTSLAKEVEKEIVPLIESIDVRCLTKYNEYYKRYSKDKFKYFVEIEKFRYFKALEIITADKGQTAICDVGCFVPYLSVALAILGYKVKIIDNYSLYNDSFKTRIHQLAEKKSIQLIDFDILRDDFNLLGRNDVVLLMAVIEHLNGTPRYLLKNIHNIISSDGFLLVDVPNIAEFLKRIRLLFGFSPLADYEHYYNSAYPHIGHNREMTVDEVRYMLGHSNFDIEYLECYDYDPSPAKTIYGKLSLLLKKVLPIKNKQGSIIAKARPKQCQKELSP